VLPEVRAFQNQQNDIFGLPQTLDFRFVALDQRYVRNEKGESELTGWGLCPDDGGNEST